MRTLLTLLFTVVLTGSVASRAEAQVRTAPDWWGGAYGMLYTSLGSVNNPDTGRWNFSDNAFGFGANLMRQFGTSLQLGVDVGYAKPSYEIVADDAITDTGDAQILTAMGTGRMAYGGATELGFYLTGGIGTIAYNLSGLDGWNSDFALRAGTGLEYRFSPARAAYLEWGRFWGYHEKEGVQGGTTNHSNLKLGLRFGF
jgi:hypothetical protein